MQLPLTELRLEIFRNLNSINVCTFGCNFLIMTFSYGEGDVLEQMKMSEIDRNLRKTSSDIIKLACSTDPTKKCVSHERAFR